MRRKLLAGFIFLAFIVTTAYQEAVLPEPGLYDNCLYPVVMLRDKGNVGSGTAFIVRSEKKGDEYWNIAITCAHNITAPDADYFLKYVKYTDGSKFLKYTDYDCIVYKKTDKRDLAIIAFKSKKKLATTELDFDSKINIGLEVIKFGCGLGGQPRLDEGKITSLDVSITSTQRKVYRTSVFTVPGDSGSPIFYKHKVVAIAEAIRKHQSGFIQYPVYGISLAIPITELKQWNDEIDSIIDFVYDKEQKIPEDIFEQDK
jgi:hypothetical protein